MKNKALILGSNNSNGLSAIRCLGKNGVHTVAVDYSEKNNYGAKSKYCAERLIAPHYREDSRGFIDFLKDYAAKQSSPPVLLACHDYYVEIIDEHLDELKGSFLIAQTEPGLNTTIMNKRLLHGLAIAKGVAVPETVAPGEANFLNKVSTSIGYPCLVKPIDSPTFVSIFRMKMFKVDSEKGLLEALEKAKDARLEVIVQRIIPGFDDHMYTYDVYLSQEAKVTHWITCQKYRQFPINYGASVYAGHCHVPELHEIGAKFLEEMQYKGFAEIEFKKDSVSGKFYMIEVNVRLTNFDLLLERLGFNVPYITYQELVGNPVEPMMHRPGTRLAFWYAYEDIIAIRDYRRAGQLTLWEVFFSLLQPKVYAIWDWKDPMPGLSFLEIIVKKLCGKVLKPSTTTTKGVSS